MCLLRTFLPVLPPAGNAGVGPFPPAVPSTAQYSHAMSLACDLKPTPTPEAKFCSTAWPCLVLQGGFPGRLLPAASRNAGSRHPGCTGTPAPVPGVEVGVSQAWLAQLGAQTGQHTLSTSSGNSKPPHNGAIGVHLVLEPSWEYWNSRELQKDSWERNTGLCTRI